MDGHIFLLVSDIIFIVLAFLGQVFNLLTQSVNRLQKELIVTDSLLLLLISLILRTHLLFHRRSDLLYSLPDSLLHLHLHSYDFLLYGEDLFLKFFLIIHKLLISLFKFLNLLNHLVALRIFLPYNFLELG